jgi:hypothetical protein
MEVANPDPILAQRLAWLISPMDLTSEETIRLKAQYLENKALMARLDEPRQAQSLPRPPQFYIETNLVAFETGDFKRWVNLIVSLALSEDGSQKFEHDPDSLPGWQIADSELRSRIAGAAIDYLECSEPPEDEILLQNSRTWAQASGGLAIAIVADTNNLQRLSNENLSRWCLVVVTHFFDAETQKRIFRKIRSIVPEAFDIAVLKRADHEAKQGNLHILDSCEDVWHLSIPVKTAVNS